MPYGIIDFHAEIGVLAQLAFQLALALERYGRRDRSVRRIQREIEEEGTLLILCFNIRDGLLSERREKVFGLQLFVSKPDSSTEGVLFYGWSADDPVVLEKDIGWHIE